MKSKEPLPWGRAFTLRKLSLMRDQYKHLRLSYVCPGCHKINDYWAKRFGYRHSRRFHMSELAVGHLWTKKHVNDYWRQTSTGGLLLPPYDKHVPTTKHPQSLWPLIDHGCYYKFQRRPVLMLTHTYCPIDKLINDQRVLSDIGLTFIEPAKVSWYYPYNATVLGICRADALCADGLVIEDARALRRVYHSQQGFKPRLVKS